MWIFVSLLIFSAFGSVKDLPNDQLTLGFGFGVSKLNLALTGPSGNRFELEPNVNNQMILSANYGHLGLSYGFRQKDVSNPEFDGTSSYDDYQIRLYYDKLLIEAFYQKYQGYFFLNPSSVVNNASSLKLPSLESTKHFTSVTYTFDSDRFSLNHPYSIDKLQTKSGGSWLLQANIAHTTLDNGNAAIVPSSSTNDYGKLNLLKKHSSFSISLGPGYGYTYIYSNLYANLTGLLLPTLQQYTFSYTDDTSDEKTKFDFSSIALKLAIGWNSEKHKFGIQVFLDNYTSKLDSEEQIDSTTIHPSLLYHYRF